MNCANFQNLLQLSFDGLLPLDHLALDAHLENCSECQSLYAAGKQLKEGLLRRLVPVAPPRLAARIVGQVMAERRATRRFYRGVLTAAVAATIFIAAFLGYRNIRPKPAASNEVNVVRAELDLQKVNPPSPALMQRRVEEAGSAFLALVGRTADEVLDQGQAMLPDQATTSTWQPKLDPSMQSLREAGENLSVGLEPVTRSARRAFDLFLREIPPVESKRGRGL